MAIQHIGGSNLKHTDNLSRNPIEGSTPEDNYHKEYVIKILFEQAELNEVYGTQCVDRPKGNKRKSKERTINVKSKLRKVPANPFRVENSKTV